MISEAEDLDAREACLRALRVPEAMWERATLSPRDYGTLLHVGFCSRETDVEESGRFITLINGQKVPGLLTSRAEQAIIDATAVLADELEDHFEFSTGRDAPPYERIAAAHAHDEFREFRRVEPAARVF